MTRDGAGRRIASPPLAVESLARRPCFTNVTLSVRAGEIVGLFGLVGSGRSELLETIFGLYQPDAGTVRVDGQPVRRGLAARGGARPGSRWCRKSASARDCSST